MVGKEATLLKPEKIKNFSEVLQIISLALAINQDIVKVDDYELSSQRLQNMTLDPQEGPWRIRKSERHNKPFVESFSGLESSFSFITRSDSDLMIGDGDVDSSTADAHIPQAVFLWHKLMPMRFRL